MPEERQLAVVYTLGQREKSRRYSFDEYGRLCFTVALEGERLEGQ